MKAHLTLILFCLSLMAFGQDYQLFNMNTHKVFRTQDELAKTYSLVFDSVVMQGSTTVYHPYKYLSDSGFSSDTCYMWNDICYFMDFPSWLGSHIQSTGDVFTFYNNSGAAVNIDFNITPSESHVFFEDDMQRFTLSRANSGSDTMNMLGTTDSVHRYIVSHTDLQGNSINSAINNWQVIIGKQLGLINFFRIDSFPQALEPLTLLGTESPAAGLFQLTNAIIYDYLPGDAIQTRDYYRNPMNPIFNRTTYITLNFLERNETADSLKYKVFREIYKYDSSIYKVDTVWIKYRKDVVVGRIPFDMPDYEIQHYGILEIVDFCGYMAWTYFTGDDWISRYYCPEDNAWCGFDDFGYEKQDWQYVAGIGLYNYHRGVAGPLSSSSSGSEITYFKKQGIECGQKVVGIEDLVKVAHSVNLIPNPSTGEFTVSGNLQNASIQILNSNGKLVYEMGNYHSGKSINLTNLPKGIYMVRVIEGKKVMTGKLVLAD